MRDPFDVRFSKLLDVLDEHRRESEKSDRERRRETEEFVEAFRKKRRDVIVPVFQEIGRALKSRGHDSFIKEIEPGRTPEGASTPASISLEIYFASLRGASGIDSPHLEYIAQDATKRVAVHVSTIMKAESVSIMDKATLALSEITPDAIRERFLQLFEQLVQAIPR
jgi:hypothetical protein